MSAALQQAYTRDRLRTIRPRNCLNAKLLRIAVACVENGKSFPSSEQLAAVLGLHPSVIDKAISGLRRRGELWLHRGAVLEVRI